MEGKRKINFKQENMIRVPSTNIKADNYKDQELEVLEEQQIVIYPPKRTKEKSIG